MALLPYRAAKPCVCHCYIYASVTQERLDGNRKQFIFPRKLIYFLVRNKLIFIPKPMLSDGDRGALGFPQRPFVLSKTAFLALYMPFLAYLDDIPRFLKRPSLLLKAPLLAI